MTATIHILPTRPPIRCIDPHDEALAAAQLALSRLDRSVLSQEALADALEALARELRSIEHD